MTNKPIKIATWNACLGILNKKDIIKRIIKDNNVDILGIQETELPFIVPETLLTIPNYSNLNVYSM